MERMSPEPGDYKKTGAAEKGSTGIIFVPGLSFVGHRSWVIVRGSLGKAAQALCRIGGDFFQQEPEIFQGLSNCGSGKEVRVVLGAADHSVRAIAHLEVQIPPGSATFDIHISHAPARRESRHIGRDRKRDRKEKVAAGIGPGLQSFGDPFERYIVIRDGAQGYFAHLVE